MFERHQALSPIRLSQANQTYWTQSKSLSWGSLKQWNKTAEHLDHAAVAFPVAIAEPAALHFWALQSACLPLLSACSEWLLLSSEIFPFVFIAELIQRNARKNTPPPKRVRKQADVPQQHTSCLAIYWFHLHDVFSYSWKHGELECVVAL